MSGHSKWSTIKRKKGALDAKRGQIFTKLIREITVATKLGGSSVETNTRLKTAIEKAKSQNMPKDNIEKAIKKGMGGDGSQNYTDILYEGYGPMGVAIMIEVLTDNKNRTAGEIRNILSKRGGNLGESGCVSYMFSKKGVISFEKDKYKEDELTDFVMGLDVEDIQNLQDGIEIITDQSKLFEVGQLLKDNQYDYDSAEIVFLPQNTVNLEKEAAEKVLNLIEALEDNDDVSNVYTNLNFDNL